MATKKFSELTTTSSPSSSALFAIADSSTSYGVTLTNIAANLPAVTATSLTSSGTLTVSGNATISGDLTIGGDDLFMNTNTSGAALIADGTNFNPVVISGDIAIATGGAATIQTDAVQSGMLNDNVISGVTKDGKLLKSYFVQYPGFVEEIRSQGTNIKVNPANSGWFMNVMVQALLPFLLLIVIWLAK